MTAYRGLQSADAQWCKRHHFADKEGGQESEDGAERLAKADKSALNNTRVDQSDQSEAPLIVTHKVYKAGLLIYQELRQG